MTEAALSLDGIRACFEGVHPSWIATCSPDGIPNVTLLSQVHYVDPHHVALSYQFFNKTRENILANARCTVQVIHPASGAVYRLSLRYLRTDSEGPLFESMKAKLAGIASHTGMEGVFRLRGADIYEALGIEEVPGGRLVEPTTSRNLLAATRLCCAALGEVKDLASVFERLLSDLHSQLGIEHAMVLMNDEEGRRLYTVASRGYGTSGVGSEIPVGHGVIGVAARERTPIRIAHMASEYAYSGAVKAQLSKLGLAEMLETEIPWPGLPAPHSQLAVPILAAGRLFGVLFVESERDLQFGYDDEDALATISSQLGLAMQSLLATSPSVEEGSEIASAIPQVGGSPAVVRHYAVDNSIFIDQSYLIKGVAGAIFWKLVREHVGEGRLEFTNREIRLDPAIRLPEASENLEARLVLLERRLAERCEFLRIEKTGRGRFRLVVTRPLKLQDMSG